MCFHSLKGFRFTHWCRVKHSWKQKRQRRSSNLPRTLQGCSVSSSASPLTVCYSRFSCSLDPGHYQPHVRGARNISRATSVPVQNTDYQVSSPHVWETVLLQCEKAEKGHQERELLINSSPPHQAQMFQTTDLGTQLWHCRDNDLICSQNAGRAGATLSGENHLFSFLPKARSKACF